MFISATPEGKYDNARAKSYVAALCQEFPLLFCAFARVCDLKRGPDTAGVAFVAELELYVALSWN